MSYEGKRPVTLEDLLRLKRAERPAPEFWADFDRQLRAKQLAALVEKRPWWRDLSHVFAGWSRFHLPVGAAAVLAVTFLTVRDFSTTASDFPVQGSGLQEQPVVDSLPSRSVEPAMPAAAEIAVHEDRTAKVEGLSASRTANIEDSTPAGESRFTPLLTGTLDASPATAETSPSARYIAANLAAIKAVEAAASSGILGAARSFDTRTLVARTVAVEPLQQMTTPSEVRLARYRSPLVVMTAEEEADRTGERIARRISGDRLYEQIGRISGRGDRVNLKF